jgi:diguanylate cyclase (GGDEF)-like protein
MFSLDYRTLLVMASIMCGFMSLIFFAAYRVYPKSIEGIREWAVGGVVTMVAATLYSLRDIAPDWLSILVANLTLTAGFYCWFVGTRRFMGLALASVKSVVAYAVVLLILLVYWTYVVPSFLHRSSLMTLVHSSFFIGQMYLVLRYGRRNFSGLFFVSVMLLALSASTLRIVATLLEDGAQFQVLLQRSLVQSIYLVVYALSSLLQTMGFFMMITDRLNEELKKEARIDPLTGAWNRRAVMEQMHVVMATAKRKAQAVSVIAMDLDHFKRINDTHGHDVGDEVLKHFSALVQEQKRPSDFFARLGGEEFILVLPDTDHQQAFDVAQRIHRQLNALADTTLPPYTVSQGVTEQRFDPSNQGIDLSIHALLKRADTAVYEAKTAGRNRVQMATLVQFAH